MARPLTGGTGRGAADAAPHVSFSQLATVERCPRQWAFKYVEGGESAREFGEAWRMGCLLDDALTAYLRGMAVDTEALRHPAFNDAVSWLSARSLDAWAPQVRCEVTVPGVRWPLFGYIDALGVSTIVDYKYTARRPDDAKLLSWQRQLNVYGIAFPGRRLMVLNLTPKGATEIEVPTAVGDVRDWARAQWARGPGAEAWAPEPGAQCGWCDYQPQCVARCKVIEDNA